MKKQGMLAVLATTLVALLAAPAAHAWPARHSVILFDGDGFETECVDFNYNAKVATLFFAQHAVPMVATANPADAGRVSLSFVLPNDSFGGLYRTHATYVDCTCTRRGTPRFQVLGETAGTASCACAATYSGINLGSVSRTEPLLGVELGQGVTCEHAYKKVVLRPRLLDRWNVDRLPNR